MYVVQDFKFYLLFLISKKKTYKQIKKLLIQQHKIIQELKEKSLN